MNKGFKILVILLLLAALVLGIIGVLKRSPSTDGTATTTPAFPVTEENQNTSPKNTGTTTTTTTNGPRDVGGVPTPAGAIVSYTGTGFSPASITISAGTPVNFENESVKGFWVASDPHPAHTGLLGFDAGRALGPGETYTFTFQTVGKFGYHNHMSPSEKGIIIVK